MCAKDDSHQAIWEPGALPSLVDLLKSTYDRTRTVTCRALRIFAQDSMLFSIPLLCFPLTAYGGAIRVAVCLQSDVFSSLVDILKSELYWTRGFAVEVFETFARCGVYLYYTQVFTERLSRGLSGGRLAVQHNFSTRRSFEV